MNNCKRIRELNLVVFIFVIPFDELTPKRDRLEEFSRNYARYSKINFSNKTNPGFTIFTFIHDTPHSTFYLL